MCMLKYENSLYFTLLHSRAQSFIHSLQSIHLPHHKFLLFKCSVDFIHFRNVIHLLFHFMKKKKKRRNYRCSCWSIFHVAFTSCWVLNWSDKQERRNTFTFLSTTRLFKICRWAGSFDQLIRSFFLHKKHCDCVICPCDCGLFFIQSFLHCEFYSLNVIINFISFNLLEMHSM